MSDLNIMSENHSYKNDLFHHLIDIISANDDRFSFEFGVCSIDTDKGLICITDKKTNMGYFLKFEEILYNEDGEFINL